MLCCLYLQCVQDGYDFYKAIVDPGEIHLSEHFIKQGGHLLHDLFVPRQVSPIEIGQRDVNADIGKQGNRFALDAILLQIFGILKICIKSLPAFERIF